MSTTTVMQERDIKQRINGGFYVVFVTGLILIGTVTFKKLKI